MVLRAERAVEEYSAARILVAAVREVAYDVGWMPCQDPCDFTRAIDACDDLLVAIEQMRRIGVARRRGRSR
jgi:hypothetical protein